MEIQTTMTQGILVMSVLGKLDSRTAPEFQKSTAELPPIPVILDLAGLEYMSSAGLRALLTLKRDREKSGNPVVLAGCRGLVDKVIRVSGFGQIFWLYPSATDALQSMAQGSA